MAKQAITAKELADVPFQMLKSLKTNFTPRDHHFIMSFKNGKTDWAYAPNERIQDLPAIKWKLMNIQKMPANKHQKAVEKLKMVLDAWL